VPDVNGVEGAPEDTKAFHNSDYTERGGPVALTPT
jgi:hypothetical protein